MTTSAQLRRDVSQMQASASQLQHQIGIWRYRIVELNQDRAGLEGFQGQVQSDRNYFERTLERKRQVGRRAGSVMNSRIAEGLALMITNRYGGSFESGVQANYNGIIQQTRRAIAQIDDELRQLNANIASAERELESLKRRIARTQSAYESALAQEHAEAERGRS